MPKESVSFSPMISLMLSNPSLSLSPETSGDVSARAGSFSPFKSPAANPWVAKNKTRVAERSRDSTLFSVAFRPTKTESAGSTFKDFAMDKSSRRVSGNLGNIARVAESTPRVLGAARSATPLAASPADRPSVSAASAWLVEKKGSPKPTKGRRLAPPGERARLMAASAFNDGRLVMAWLRDSQAALR